MRTLLALVSLVSSTSVLASSELGSATELLQIPLGMNDKIYIAISLIYFFIFIAGAVINLKAYRDNPKQTPIGISLFLFVLAFVAGIMPFTFALSNAVMFGSGVSCAAGWSGSGLATCSHPESPELKLITIAIGLVLSLSVVLLALERFKAYKTRPDKNSIRLSLFLFVLGALLLILPYVLISVFNIGG